MKTNVMQEFVRLAANKNYSKTAEELFIAQSALSRHIAAMEEELHVKLINRDRNSFELTPAGKIVLEEFQRILENYEKMLEKIARLEEIESGELRLGYLYYDADYYVSRIRDMFRKSFPGIKLILLAYQPVQLEEELLAGKLDAALLYGVSGTSCREVDYMPFLKLPCSLFYHSSHRLSSLKDIAVSDLDGEKLLCPERPFKINHVRDMTEQMLRKGGARISEYIPVGNYDEVPWILEETGGIYISPMVNASPYGRNTEHRFLLPDVYTTDISVVWLRQKTDPSVRLLCKAIKICYP